MVKYIYNINNDRDDVMGIFNNIFTTKREQTINMLLNNKQNTNLMCTSRKKYADIHSFGPVYNNELKKMVVFATDDEKTAILYALKPMYYFSFEQNEKAALVVGDNHSLLKLDSIVAYIYTVDSSSFEPVVSEQGEFNHEWLSTTDVHIRSDVPIKKVTFKDVLKSGVQVFWVKDRHIVEEFDRQIQSSGFTTGNQKLDFLKDQANWYPDKVVYMNAYEKIGLATQTESGWTVPKEKVTFEEITPNKNGNIAQYNNSQNLNNPIFPNQINGLQNMNVYNNPNGKKYIK